MLAATAHSFASRTVNDLWEGVCLSLRSFASHPEMSASSSRYRSQRLQWWLLPSLALTLLLVDLPSCAAPAQAASVGDQ